MSKRVEQFHFNSKVQFLQNSLKYVCSLCTKFSTSLPEEILKHFTESHKAIRFMNCVYCCQNFRIPQYLQHVEEHFTFIGHSRFACKICNMSFDLIGIKSLMDHVSLSHNDSNKCPVCLAEFAEKEDLYYHIMGSIEILYHCGNVKCLVKSHNKDHFLQHFDNNLTCDKDSFTEEIINSCLYRKYNETCCYVVNHEKKKKKLRIISTASIPLFNETSVTWKANDLTLPHESSSKSSRDVKNRNILSPIEFNGQVGASSSFKKEINQNVITIECPSQISIQKNLESPTTSVSKVNGTTENKRKSDLTLSFKNLKTNPSIVDSAGKNNDKALLSPIRSNNPVSSSISNQQIEISNCDTTNNSPQTCDQTELDKSNTSNQISKVYELKYSKRILKKLLAKMPEEEFSKLSRSLKKYERYTFNVEFIKSKKYFVCTKCKYKSSHSSSDVRKHILRVHCDVGVSLLLPCIQANKLDSNYSLCSDQKMIESINLLRRRSRNSSKGDLEFLSDSENEDLTSKVQLKRSLPLDESINEIPKRLKYDDIKLNYSEAVLRHFCQKENQLDMFEDLNLKMKTYASIAGIYEFESSKILVRCSVCSGKFTKPFDFSYHVLAVHAFIPYNLRKMVKYCCRYNRKTYELLTDEEMINYIPKK